MQRPTAITVICVLGFIGAGLTVFAIPLVLSMSSHFPSWYLPYLLMSCVVGLGLMIGLWRMKKVAALGYVGFTALNQVVLLASHQWTIMSLVIPAIVCGIAMKHLDQME